LGNNEEGKNKEISQDWDKKRQQSGNNSAAALGMKCQIQWCTIYAYQPCECALDLRFRLIFSNAIAAKGARRRKRTADEQGREQAQQGLTSNHW
jgi:hypothetical protein